MYTVTHIHTQAQYNPSKSGHSFVLVRSQRVFGAERGNIFFDGVVCGGAPGGRPAPVTMGRTFSTGFALLIFAPHVWCFTGMGISWPFSCCSVLVAIRILGISGARLTLFHPHSLTDRDFFFNLQFISKSQGRNTSFLSVPHCTSF